MIAFPTFSSLRQSNDINRFAECYTACSGFQVPSEYYTANRVFGVRFRGQMVGGFVLASGNTLRTLEVFAGPEHRDELYQTVRQSAQATELCCFWMAPACRRNVLMNFFTWCCVAYALQRYGTPQLVFGTNSVRLAALYANASKGKLLHTDYLNHKRTFVFAGPRQYCLLGVAQILCCKTKRMLKTAGFLSAFMLSLLNPAAAQSTSPEHTLSATMPTLGIERTNPKDIPHQSDTDDVLASYDVAYPPSEREGGDLLPAVDICPLDFQCIAAAFGAPSSLLWGLLGCLALGLLGLMARSAREQEPK